ncbi:MAG: hypothetical protein IJS08_13805 [Victivallales bacterium]|nr:hypothetical protein [Victivallales bacterium]
MSVHISGLGLHFVLNDDVNLYYSSASNKAELDLYLEFAERYPDFMAFIVHFLLAFSKKYFFWPSSYGLVYYAFFIIIGIVFGRFLSFLFIYKCKIVCIMLGPYVLINRFFITDFAVLLSSIYLLGGWYYAVVYYIAKIALYVIYNSISCGHCELNSKIVLRYWK